MGTRITSAAIVLFWLVMMFSLFKDKILPQQRALKTAAVDVATLILDWQDTDDWFAVTINGKTIGGMRLTVEESGRPVGYRVNLNVIVNLRVLRRELQVWVRGAIQLDSQFLLDYGTLSLQAWNVAADLRFRSMPDGRLLISVEPDEGERDRFVVPLASAISLAEAVRPLALRRLDLTPGQSYVMDVIDPIYQMQRGELRLTVEGYDFLQLEDAPEPVNAVLITSELVGIATKVWTDRTGRILRRQLAPNREMYLDRVEGGDAWMERYPKMQPFLEERVDPVALEADEFADAPERKLSELVNAGMFQALSVLPETEAP